MTVRTTHHPVFSSAVLLKNMFIHGARRPLKAVLESYTSGQTFIEQTFNRDLYGCSRLLILTPVKLEASPASASLKGFAPPA